MLKNNGHLYIRTKTYPVEKIINAFVNSRENRKKEYDGVNFGGKHTQSKKLRTFVINGTTCYLCGLEGKFFAKERHKGEANWHFNLYGVATHKITGEQIEIQFTMDHIKPVAKKGSVKKIENLLPCCYRCNQEKADKHESEMTKIKWINKYEINR